jgi:four helix bundle protein
MKRYKNLVAWQRCHELALAVYRATEQWPAAERYGLTAQLRRSAASAPTNIAEGSAKRGKAEFRRFLDISLGSLAEVSYQLELARDLGFLTVAEWEAIEAVRDAAGRVTWLLYRSLHV